MNGSQMSKKITRAKEHKRIRTQGLRDTGILCTYAFLICVLALTGCAEQQQYTSAESEPLLIENIDKLRAMEIAEDVLVKMHFTIDKANDEAGFIKTKPLTGAQMFEFWRSDSVGADNWLQNNLHSIRRLVVLKIDKRNNDIYIDCDVQIYRLSIPQRDVSSGSRAYNMFSPSSEALQVIQLHPEQKEDMAWINLGKDSQLEAEILKRIEMQIVSGQAVSNKI